MLLLITGGSGSGKSAYAEKRVLELEIDQRIYLATMMCYDDETRRRIDRHRSMRDGKGFITLERPFDLEHLNLDQAAGIRETGRTVLLECLSNLTANEMFDPSGSGKDTLRAVKNGIDTLLGQCDNLVVVTNEIFSDGILYDRETAEYQEVLGSLNCMIAKDADEVTEVVYGIPILHKPAGGDNT